MASVWLLVIITLFLYGPSMGSTEIMVGNHISMTGISGPISTHIFCVIFVYKLNIRVKRNHTSLNFRNTFRGMFYL